MGVKLCGKVFTISESRERILGSNARRDRIQAKT